MADLEFRSPLFVPAPDDGNAPARSSHTHNAGDVGAAAAVHSHSPSILTPSYAATVAPDASSGPVTIHRITATGALQINAPTGSSDGWVVNVEVLASGTTVAVTIQSAILLTGDIASPISVASGKRWFGAMRSVGGTWYLLASSVQN